MIGLILEGIAKLASRAGFSDFFVGSIFCKVTYPFGHRLFAKNRIQRKKRKGGSEWSFAIPSLTCFLLAGHPGLIRLADEIIAVEVVSSERDRAIGLMGREELSDSEGMLFVYNTPQMLSFWMKGTLIPLSIGFFDEHQILLSVEEMAVPEKGWLLKTYRSQKPALYALEVPKGWFERRQIKPGMRFEWISDVERKSYCEIPEPANIPSFLLRSL